MTPTQLQPPRSRRQAALTPANSAAIPSARRCGGCGKFIGHSEETVFEFEPLNEFGPEKAEHFHKGCA